jgi:hypothetical protein
MKKHQSSKIYVLILLLCCFIVAPVSVGFAKSYTAETYLRVLPYPDNDPTVIRTPDFDRQIQQQFRCSLAALMKQESFLTDLLERDKIRNTNWFKNLAKGSKTITPEVLADLEKNLQAEPSEDMDLILVSMSCAEPQEAADIVNEAVDLFVTKQRDRRVSDVRNMLVELEKRRQSLEREIDLAEQALDDVRSSTDFTDLEEKTYPSPQEVRLNRLRQTKDELEIALAEAQAIAKIEQSDQDPNEQQRQVIICRAKLERVERMLAEATAEKKRLDLAKILYRQRARIRDQIQFQLDQLKDLIEKRRILAEDPAVSKVWATGRAVVPISPD